MRAAVDDPDLLDLQGTNPVRVRRLAWMIGCTFASLSGVLIVPLVGLQPLHADVPGDVRVRGRGDRRLRQHPASRSSAGC